MTRARRRPVGRYLESASPEALFVLSGVAQYLGATIAISLFDEVEAGTVAWLRVLGAAVTLAVVGRGFGRRWTASDIRVVAAFGVATALMNLFFYLAIDRIPLGTAVAIEFIGPVSVAAARTRSGRNALALSLAATGVAVLAGIELDGEPLGLLFVGLAAVMWSAYIVLGSRVAQLRRGVTGLAAGLVVGTIILAPVGAPTSGPVWRSPALLGACLLVGVFSSAVGYGIDQHTMRRIPVRRFSVLSALLPITAVVVAFLALDQRPGVVQLAGIALVVCGVVVQDREQRPAPVRVGELPA